jgi:hypothetical protein
MRSAGLLVCGALAGCRFDLPLSIDAGTTPTDGDLMTPDQAPADAQLCFGAGLGKVCLPSLPSAERTLTGPIDTTIDGNCTHLITITGTEACVVTGTNINIMGSYRGRGDRPLVIVATGTLAISGVLDVGSERGSTSGAGSSNLTCSGLSAPGNDDGGGGGGAGGGFGGMGGTGGPGDGNNNGNPAGTAPGGTTNTVVTAAQVTQLRAGCRGGNGGSGGGGSSPGSGGRGGGVVYLLAGTEINVAGRVLANGAGGNAGAAQGGGGGGGSGGMIGLDAPTVTVTGYVIANGGSGGEGGALSGNSTPGSNGRDDGQRALGGQGGDPEGGNGGDSSGGSGGGGLTGGNGELANGGGGGGGGGAGFIYVKGQFQPMGSATVSPAAYQAP